MSTRIEHDLLGDYQVPTDAYWGVHTARALENFPISGVPIGHYRSLVKALAQVKEAAARAAVLDTLHKAIGDELKAAKRELEDGLRAAKAETGTQKISVSLNEGQDIGSISLIQPKAGLTKFLFLPCKRLPPC